MKQALSIWITLFSAILPAAAAPVSWTFQGEVIASYVPDGSSSALPANVGKTVTGFITFDPDSARECELDISTARHTCFTSDASPIAQATDGTHQVAIDSTSAATGKTAVYRQWDTSLNTYYVGAYTDTHAVDFFVQDWLGTASSIFTEVDGGLRWDQRINWFPDGAISIARINYGFGTVAETVRLDRITTTINGISTTQIRAESDNGNEIPEPSTILSLTVGLAALLAARGRRKF